MNFYTIVPLSMENKGKKASNRKLIEIELQSKATGPSCRKSFIAVWRRLFRAIKICLGVA